MAILERENVEYGIQHVTIDKPEQKYGDDKYFLIGNDGKNLGIMSIDGRGRILLTSASLTVQNYKPTPVTS